MDGQGIGHTADSTSSLPTSVTSRFRIADAIVLVDNAAQPMQAGPCAALESLVISGHESKLILAFTHFDEVKGDNLRGNAAKKDHVVGSFDNAIHAIGKKYGLEAESALRNLIPERLVFLSNIQKRVPDSAKFTLFELNRFLEAIEASIIPAGPVEYHPIYDVANLVLAIQKAAQEFHERWKGIFRNGVDCGRQARALDKNQSPLKSSGYFQGGRIRYAASCSRPHSTSANSCQPIPFESPWMDTVGSTGE